MVSLQTHLNPGAGSTSDFLAAAAGARIIASDTRAARCDLDRLQCIRFPGRCKMWCRCRRAGAVGLSPKEAQCRNSSTVSAIPVVGHRAQSPCAHVRAFVNTLFDIFDRYDGRVDQVAAVSFVDIVKRFGCEQ